MLGHDQQTHWRLPLRAETCMVVLRCSRLQTTLLGICRMRTLWAARLRRHHTLCTLLPSHRVHPHSALHFVICWIREHRDAPSKRRSELEVRQSMIQRCIRTCNGLLMCMQAVCRSLQRHEVMRNGLLQAHVSSMRHPWHACICHWQLRSTVPEAELARGCLCPERVGNVTHPRFGAHSCAALISAKG